jgi:retron-type reverse transcriptase
MNLLKELFIAYYKARKNKRNTVNQLKFELNLEKNIWQLYQDIKNRKYKLSPCIAFIVKEPKMREVFAADFRDRVVHHLVFNWIEEFWEKQFIYDSYSCRVGKGTHFGIRRVSKFMRGVSSNYSEKAYILKLDISNYFINLRKDLIWDKCLWSLNKMEISSKKKKILKYLLPIIIFTDQTKNVRVKNMDNWQHLAKRKSLFFAKKNCGLPIGNLTSQLFSNIYLHELDCFIKYELKFRYYGRYVDDFIILDKSKKKLKSAKNKVENFLKTNLFLELNQKKTFLSLVDYGIDFLGGNVKPYYIKPRKRLIKKIFFAKQNDWKKIKPKSWASYLGHLKNFNSWRIRYGLVLPLGLDNCLNHDLLDLPDYLDFL